MSKPIKICNNPDCTRRVYLLERDYCGKCWIRLTDEGRAYNAKRQREHQNKVRAHYAAMAAMKVAPLLLICAGAAWSDVLPKNVGAQAASSRPPQADPLDPLGYIPAQQPPVPGGATTARIFDAPITGSRPVTGPTLLASWRGAPESTVIPGLYGPGLGVRAGGSSPSDANGDGKGASCERGNASFCPKPPSHQPAVPGPLPLLGVAAAWGWARRLRRRVG